MGLSTPSTAERKPRSVIPVKNGRKKPRVAFVTSNGAGMGHLTRLLGIARAVKDELEIVFVSLSQASPVVEKFGFPFVYIASSSEAGLSAKDWNAYARQRFGEEFAWIEPDAVLFDGTWIYGGLREALNESGIPLIWSRRGMWKEHIPDRSLANSRFTAGVIEPGECAAEFDHGATTRVADAIKVNPITIVSRNELMDKESARSYLGLREGENAVLVTLGAGNLNSLDETLSHVVAALQSEAPGWKIFLTSNPIAGGREAFEGVESLDYYPVVNLANGFDAVVSASGYNSYHEWIMAGVPALWIPNLETQADDQRARAVFADRTGIGVCVEEPTAESVSAAIKRLVDPNEQRAMRSALEAASSENGAYRAAQELTQMFEKECEA